MPRPPFRRKIGSAPGCSCFKPAGIPARDLEEVVLTVDEYEAVRLADLEGLYQEKVAEQMGVSRQTIGRILQTARRKIADVLVNGKMLRIEGGAVVTEGLRGFICKMCGNDWQLPFGGGRPAGCPACGSEAIRRCDFDERVPGRHGHGHHEHGHEHGHGRGHGRGCDGRRGPGPDCERRGDADGGRGHGRGGRGRQRSDDAGDGDRGEPNSE